MNIIDLALLLVLFISIIFGIYRHSISSLLGLAACLFSFLFAFMAGPQLAAWLGSNQGLTGMLASYTDASSLVGDFSLASTKVAGMSESTLEAVIKNVDLPQCIELILRDNLASAIFERSGVITVNDYIASTIVTAILQSASFVVCYFLCFIVLHFFISLLDHVLQFPVLKFFDGPVAAVFGLLRGVLVLYVLFLLVPVLETAIPLDLISNYIGRSVLAPIFESDGFFLRVVTGG